MGESSPAADGSEPSSESSDGLLSRFFSAFRPDAGAPEQIDPAAPNQPRPADLPLGLMNLRQMRVEDVSVPKADITAVPVGITREELVETFRETGKTRLPVFDGTLDTPIGLVNLKDFALHYGFDCTSDAFDLRGILRQLLYVPPSMPLGVLLQKMQAERIHMALVIDEYGGTDGLVTIEDLIEQVVGEIEDEHDLDEEAPFTQEKDGVYLALAKCPLEEFEAEIGQPLTDDEEIDEEEIDTLGGLVFMLAGRVPSRGEVIPHPSGPEFEVIDADPRRIKRMRVRMVDQGRED
ncbi:MAG: magnesium/cobalt efflux protein [Rhodobacterales bacterium]|nr:MAG: magnesium/cobalt efflux protein [Rhodobacterales bacterium]